jgi:hypothetical protein
VVRFPTQEGALLLLLLLEHTQGAAACCQLQHACITIIVAICM